MAAHIVRFAVALAAALALLAGAATTEASASRSLIVGLYDEGSALFGEPSSAFPLLRTLRTEALRVTLYWGGPQGVSRGKPFRGANPADLSYDWALYDRLVTAASRYGVRVVFSIWGTPDWANGGRGPNVAPSRPKHLEKFAYAAAKRYSGSYRGADKVALPAVDLWLAWNEPNLTTFLTPQYRRVGGRFVVQSAIDYAAICNAVYDGVHGTMLDGKKVGCGTTGPGGNNNPRSERPSVAPLAFLRAMWKAGARDFDAYDHHPYYSSRFDTPSTRSEVPSRIMLGNIDRLVRQLTRLYGRKPVWISEYGFQTNPPDRGIFGVPWALQARHLREAYAIARLHPRIDMMLWFLIRDERRVDGWQSGLLTASGKRKPAFGAFRRLPRCDRHPDLGPLAPPKGRRGPPARADSFAGATLENDVLNGSPGADRISGLLGQDILSGLEGTDCLDGGEDRDDLAGGRGADILFGGEGDDILSGGPGDDMLGGGPGDDRLDGGPGRNTYSGDDGDDFIDAANGAVDTVACGRGTDAVLADASDSILGCERVKRLRRAPR